jgi:hypothetical protein
VVTGFFGVRVLKPDADSQIEDLLVIDTQAAALHGRSGEASLFANVVLDGVANSGPALGSAGAAPAASAD